jgi:hypothetical protein
MTEQLRLAFEAAQRLPNDVQNTLAAHILEEIDEQEWDQIVSQTHVQQALIALADEAMRQEVAGETENGGFGNE